MPQDKLTFSQFLTGTAILFVIIAVVFMVGVYVGTQLN